MGPPRRRDHHRRVHRSPHPVVKVCPVFCPVCDRLSMINNMVRTDVEFRSEGVTLRGWLYRPESSTEPTPLVVMAHGFVGHREWVAPTAEVFAARGLSCLV